MLTFYGHPISSFTWKALIALYENDTPFDFITVDQTTFADFIAKWPMGKFPVLIDSDRKMMTTETSVIIEYLDTYYLAGLRRCWPAGRRRSILRAWTQQSSRLTSAARPRRAFGSRRLNRGHVSCSRTARARAWRTRRWARPQTV